MVLQIFARRNSFISLDCLIVARRCFGHHSLCSTGRLCYLVVIVIIVAALRGGGSDDGGAIGALRHLFSARDCCHHEVLHQLVVSIHQYFGYLADYWCLARLADCQWIARSSSCLPVSATHYCSNIIVGLRFGQSFLRFKLNHEVLLRLDAFSDDVVQHIIIILNSGIVSASVSLFEHPGLPVMVGCHGPGDVTIIDDWYVANNLDWLECCVVISWWDQTM